MSTKATLYYDDSIAVSEELLDNSIVITLEDVEFWVEATPRQLTLTLPLRVWATIRKYSSDKERYLEMSDDDVRAEAQTSVASRMARHDLALLAGEVPASFDEQVEEYVDFFRQIRDEDIRPRTRYVPPKPQ